MILNTFGNLGLEAATASQLNNIAHTIEQKSGWFEKPDAPLTTLTSPSEIFSRKSPVP